MTAIAMLLVITVSLKAQEVEYIKPDVIETNQQLPTVAFRKVVGRDFSFLTLGSGSNTPLVNRVTLDMLEAKFDFNAALSLGAKNSCFLNVGIKGDKNGNISTLFGGKKAGSNFEGDLKIHVPIYKKFYFNDDGKTALVEKISIEEAKGDDEIYSAQSSYLNDKNQSTYNDILRLKKAYSSLINQRDLLMTKLEKKEKELKLKKVTSKKSREEKDSTVVKTETKKQSKNKALVTELNTSLVKYQATLDSVNTVLKNVKKELADCFKVYDPSYVSDTIQRIEKKVASAKENIYNNATWSSAHRGWITFQASPGGQKFYTIQNVTNLSYLNDTVLENNFFTIKESVAGNYYYNNFSWLTLLASIDVGFERSSNQTDLGEKYTVTYNAKGIDSSGNKGFAQDRSASIKYEAYKGEAKLANYITHNFNVYTLFGKSQLFGLHLFNNLRAGLGDAALTNFTGLGVIANVPNKKEEKSLIGFELYWKLRTDGQEKFDLKSEGISEIGLQFNVPILAIQGKKKG